MTKQNEVIGDENYIPLLDKGFVGLVDSMGDDASIVQAARVSYGKGTKAVQSDRGLIRYLLRNKHTTPFEMVEFKFHCKMPIFVARQWIRHRTASTNEYSGRYSIINDDYYVPDDEHIQPQSKDNKQGRAGTLSLPDLSAVKGTIISHSEDSYVRYKELLGEVNEDEYFTKEYEGIAREIARMVLPLNFYTEWYWKCNLHNLFHFEKLRMDSHAQYEVRVYANAMYELMKPYVPLAVEAFEDYSLYAESMSRMEMIAIKLILEDLDVSNANNDDWFNVLLQDSGLSTRELGEFAKKLGL